MSGPGQYMNKNSKWIKIPTGGSYTGIYLGWQPGEKFRGNDTVEYKFSDGKILSSSSKRLAAIMERIPYNTEITIKKFGEKMDTVYEVEIEKKDAISKLTDPVGKEW